MTPTFCQIRHDPPNDQWGDCLRACIATVLDLPHDDVPHFADHGRNSDAAFKLMRTWAKQRGLAPYLAAYPATSLSELLDMQRTLNPDSVYVLFGGTSDGTDHCVVCRGGEVVHNPAWYGSSLVGPTSAGWWQVLVMGRV